MNSNRPLSDAWLFWNPERLEEFPHAHEDDCACAPAEGDTGDHERESGALSMLEDLLLYVAGVSAAMVGVGLAVLFGSFISAYSALNSAGAPDRAALPAEPYLSMERRAEATGGPAPEAIVIEPKGAEAAAEGQVNPVRGIRSSPSLAGS